MVVMCTYSLRISRAVELMDVMRRHQLTVTLRNGEWELLETPGLRRIKREIGRVNDALDVLSRPFPGHVLLTGRERDMLAYIVRGASSKEVGRMLGVSPRTVEFHRVNIMRKVGAKNAVDLVRRVLE
jgi:DNA-binding CsgD family transcriptional regulator